MTAFSSQRNSYEVVIGIEVHVQLTTHSKIFCSCANRVGQEPNSTICPICTGHPGVLPVLNEKVVDYAIKAGLGTQSTIALKSEFDRKHYFYPDLPKGYQITQNRLPICTNGSVAIRLEDGTVKNIRLIRIHIEEDAGKSLHSATGSESFVDLNRAGTPLLEIVSHPDISSSYEAKAYLKALRLIVQYVGICTGNMEEGAFRADTNISVRKKGETKLGTKVELKNINSFKFIGDAIEFEIDRQINALESGETIKQETRLWDSKEHKTYIMRSKEEAADYRYFQEPDLPAIVINQEEIDALKEKLPELPFATFERLCRQGLTAAEAEILVDDPALARYFEEAYALRPSKTILNWILRDLMEYIKEHKISIDQCKITAQKLASLITLLEQGVINASAAKQIFVIVAQTGKEPHVLVKELGLEQIGSMEELAGIVDTILANNKDEVERFKAGEQKLFGFFVGEAMKATQGKGNPKIVQELLKKKLQS